jgi:hypothetical protein
VWLSIGLACLGAALLLRRSNKWVPPNSSTETLA